MKSAGDYAELWSHLKSMEHALERVQTAASLKEIADLDRARLLALAAFLKKELETRNTDTDLSSAAFLAYKAVGYGYSLDVDLRTMLQDLPRFREWLRSQKPSFAEKSARLINALEGYVAKVSEQVSERLFPDNDPPKTEFRILHDLLSRLLQQTESALVA